MVRVAIDPPVHRSAHERLATKNRPVAPSRLLFYVRLTRTRSRTDVLKFSEQGPACRTRANVGRIQKE